MNEAEWLANDDPLPMVAHLRKRKKITERQTRLWGCACARQAWELLTDERSRHAVAMAEEFADGVSDRIATAKMDAEHTVNPFWRVGGRVESARRSPEETAAAHLARCCCWREGIQQSSMFAEDIPGRGIATYASQCIAPATAAALLREIVGNPFQSIVILDGAGQRARWADGQNVLVFDKEWLAWNDGTVLRMAQRIYDARSFEDLPILADALEDASCSDAGILRHLRGEERCPECGGTGEIELPDPASGRTTGEWVRPCTKCVRTGWVSIRGPHVRGCHVLDALTGRQ